MELMNEIKIKTEMEIAQLRVMANNLDKESRKDLLMLLDYARDETNKFIEELREEVENETKD